MYRLNQLAKELYNKEFKALFVEQQQILIGIQRNEIEDKRNKLMDDFNISFRGKQFRS